MIEVDSPWEEVVDTQVKIEEIEDDANDDVSVQSGVSRASSSLEQEVHRARRIVY